MRVQRIYQLKPIEKNHNLFDSVTRTLADLRFLAPILILPPTHTPLRRDKARVKRK